LLCSTHASSKRELLRSLQELFMGPGISSSAFWVSKGLRVLKILTAISALYNQKYCYATSGIYHNVISPSIICWGLVQRQMDRRLPQCMVHPPEPSVIKEGREENTHLLICAGGGEYQWQFSTVGDMQL
jgi:hypothetical protein